MDSKDSFDIDYDSAAPGKSRPTYGAIQVVELLGNLTVTYRRVRRFSQKFDFFVDIQAEISDKYEGVLDDALNTYNTVVNPLSRRMQGISKWEELDLKGIGGIKRLCKVYGSADFIISTMQEWSNDEVCFPSDFHI